MAAVLEQGRRIDVLVNNGTYNGPGLLYDFDEFSIDDFETCLRGTVVNQARLARQVLPGMLERGEGAVVFMGSVAGAMVPPAAPSAGGWGLLHGASKSAFHRIAEFLQLEHGKDGIRSFLVEPQHTRTEAMEVLFAESPRPSRAHTPEVTGEVVAWLVSHPDGKDHVGRLLSTPTFFAEHGITP